MKLDVSTALTSLKKPFPVAFCSRQLVRATCSNAGNGSTVVLSSSGPCAGDGRGTLLEEKTTLTHIRARESKAKLILNRAVVSLTQILRKSEVF